MAQDFAVLGQVALGATTLTDIYTVPVGKTAVISSLVFCNRDSTARTYRLSIAVAGEADDVKQYLAYDAPIGANIPIAWQIGKTLGESDVIRAYASSAVISVNVFGTEMY